MTDCNDTMGEADHRRARWMPGRRFRALRAWTWCGHRPDPAQSTTFRHRPDRRAPEQINNAETLTTTPLMLIIVALLSARGGWSPSTEITGRHQPKRVVGID
jgi:hypothetical protein